MSKFHDKAEAQAKQIIGQMFGDELLVREGREQLEHAGEETAQPADADQGGDSADAGKPVSRVDRPPRR